MKTSGFRLAATLALAAAAGGAAIAPWLVREATTVRVAAAAGFLAVAVPTVAGAVWLARSHGRPGLRFVVALGATTVARLSLAIAALVAAGSLAGAREIGAAAIGMAAAFVPALACETAWLVRSPGARA